MNHVLQYTQLKFKLDLLMKPEILGSIPSGVAICGPSPDPPDQRDSLLKEKKEIKKLSFPVLKKHAPGEERCCMESPVTFYFYF